MPYLKKSLCMLLILGNFTVSIADFSIDEKIENIKNAPADKRVEMMNKFKLQMAQMNQQERSDTISKLQEKILHQKQDNTKVSDAKINHKKLDEKIDSSFQNTQYNHSTDMILNQPNMINKR